MEKHWASIFSRPMAITRLQGGIEMDSPPQCTRSLFICDFLFIQNLYWGNCLLEVFLSQKLQSFQQFLKYQLLYRSNCLVGCFKGASTSKLINRLHQGSSNLHVRLTNYLIINQESCSLISTSIHKVFVDLGEKGFKLQCQQYIVTI